MDHDEVREQLELAAAEPGGLERLTAGDAPAARMVAAHLAGCDSCATELQRLERAAPLLRDLVRTTPPPELRARTLAFVAAHGLARRPMAAAGATLGSAAIPVGIGSAASVPGPIARSRVTSAGRGGRALLPWVGAIAAAVVISVVAATAFVSTRFDTRLATLDRQVDTLESVTIATVDISSAADTERVALAATDGSAANGKLLYSPSTAQLVVVATGLIEPPDGQEYRCWIESNGTRTSIGRMYFADKLAYWIGPAPSVAEADPGTSFGVSLTDVGTSVPAADPVIAGAI